jgi:hypothetical protein
MSASELHQPGSRGLQWRTGTPPTHRHTEWSLNQVHCSTPGASQASLQLHVMVGTLYKVSTVQLVLNWSRTVKYKLQKHREKENKNPERLQRKRRQVETDFETLKEVHQGSSFCKLRNTLRTNQQLGMVVHACHPSYSEGWSRRTASWRLAWGHSKTPSQKQNKTNPPT